MKLCTKMRVKAYDVVDGQVVIRDAQIIDVSAVPDDHVFGFAEWPWDVVHIEGRLDGEAPSAE